ncbi:sugar ABC transporter ATP-binding protein [Zobellella maritima]|uniref:sugar ABC transporter ATP-binding protein n=1 Tax=Zobellella maritima TaxID=2059725 RepID=UPI0018E5135B|nr:sugar ABC transporter ATP-binding protein [Zobellella maritima]
MELQDTTKAFGPHQVLKGVNLRLPAGKVTALMGANGAGKSTLVKVLCGMHRADTGRLLIDGRAVTLNDPRQANAAGIVTVHQHINDNVVLTLTVAENLLLDQLSDGRLRGLLGRRRLAERARPLAEAVGLDIPMDIQVAELGQAERQLLAIARALAHHPRLLILDEPTSTLSDAEAERLFVLVERLRARGTGVLYISHRLSDIRRLADRVVALRDGVIVLEQDTPDLPRAVQAMLGHGVGEVTHTYRRGGRERFRLQQVRLAGGTPPFYLSLREGEITVATGLLSSGAMGLLQAIYGLKPLVSGTMYKGGKPWSPRGPSEAIKGGVFMVQEDRASAGIIPGFSLRQNLSLPFLSRFSRWGLLDRHREAERAKYSLDQAGVVYQSDRQTMSALSGGNQQKLMLARWLQQPCELLLLAEPFQGVDIGARRDIGHLLRRTADERATLVVCTDLEEALELADRLLVFNHHRLVGDHRVEQLNMEQVLQQIAALPEHIDEEWT